MEKPLKATVAVYTLIMIASLTLLPLTGGSSNYTLIELGPLPRDFQGQANTLYYDGGDTLVVKAVKQGGVDILYTTGGETVSYTLAGVSDVFSACKLGDKLIVEGRDPNYNAVLAVLGDNPRSLHIIHSKAPLPADNGGVYCGEDGPVIIASFPGKVAILSVNLSSGRAVGVLLPGEYITSAHSGGDLYIGLSYNASTMVIQYDLGGRRVSASYRVESGELYKLLYSGKPYAVLLSKTKALVAPIHEGTVDALTITYNGISAPKVEAVKEREGNLYLLSRPPAGWMQVVEVRDGVTSNVEVMYNGLYSFQEAGTLKEGLFWTAGILYNESSKFVTIALIHRDGVAIVGRDTGSILAGKKTTSRPSTEWERVVFQPISVTGERVEATLSVYNTTITGPRSLTLQASVYGDGQDPVRAFLSSLALTLAFTLPAYTSSKIYLEPKHLSPRREED